MGDEVVKSISHGDGRKGYRSGVFFGHLCGMDCALKCRKIEFLKKILEFLTKILPDDVIVTIKI